MKEVRNDANFTSEKLEYEVASTSGISVGNDCHEGGSDEKNLEDMFIAYIVDLLDSDHCKD